MRSGESGFGIPFSSFPRRRESRIVPHLHPFGLRYRSLVPLSAVGLVHCVRPRRDFAPAGDLLSCIDKKGGKEATPADSALALRGLPCAARSLRVGQNSLRGRWPLRSNSRPKSVIDARCARPAKPCAAQLVRRGRRTPAGLASRRPDGLGFAHADAKRGADRESCEATTVLLLGPF